MPYEIEQFAAKIQRGAAKEVGYVGGLHFGERAVQAMRIAVNQKDETSIITPAITIIDPEMR